MQSLGIVTGEDELYGAKKPGVKLWLLVGDILANTVAYRHAAVFQLDHAHGDAVDIKHQIGSPVVITLKRYFLSNGKIVLFWIVPVDQPDCRGILIRSRFYRYAIAQQTVDLLVIVIETAVRVSSFGAESVESSAALSLTITALGQISREQSIFDIAVIRPISPVAKVAIAQFVMKQSDDTVLCCAFGLTDDGQ